MRIFLSALAICLAASGAFAKPPHKPQKPKQATEQAAPAPVGDPNGSWSIEAATTVGECPMLIPDAVQIADNKIVPAPSGGVSSWGYVDEEGTIVARFTGEGERVARFHGTLRSGKGTGAWSSSTDMCGGIWRAWRTEAAAQ